MKKIFAWTILFALLLTLTACGSGGYDTPEEAALAFSRGRFENNMELFNSSIHPDTYEYMISTFDPLSNDPCIVNDLRVIGVQHDGNATIIKDSKIGRCLERMEDGILKKESYVIVLEDTYTVELWINFIETNDRDGHQQTATMEFTVMCVNGSWYVINQH